MRKWMLFFISRQWFTNIIFMSLFVSKYLRLNIQTHYCFHHIVTSCDKAMNAAYWKKAAYHGPAQSAKFFFFFYSIICSQKIKDYCLKINNYLVMALIHFLFIANPVINKGLITKLKFQCYFSIEILTF